MDDNTLNCLAGLGLLVAVFLGLVAYRRFVGRAGVISARRAAVQVARALALSDHINPITHGAAVDFSLSGRSVVMTFERRLDTRRNFTVPTLTIDLPVANPVGCRLDISAVGDFRQLGQAVLMTNLPSIAERIANRYHVSASPREFEAALIGDPELQHYWLGPYQLHELRLQGSLLHYLHDDLITNEDMLRFVLALLEHLARTVESFDQKFLGSRLQPAPN